MTTLKYVECNFEFRSHLQLGSHTKRAGTSSIALWSVWVRVEGLWFVVVSVHYPEPMLQATGGLVSGTGARFISHVG